MKQNSEVRIQNLKFSRRDIIKCSGLATLAGLAGCGQMTGTKNEIGEAPYLDYASIEVVPVVNCWGAMTTMGGSLILPEAKKAMMEAANSFVRMGELMEGVGNKLAELTGAEWGVITSGCAAALFVATSGVITGGDPKKVAKIPDTEGMKNECIVSSGHRTGYDCAVKMAGVRMIEADSPEEMEAAFNEKTAMIFVLGEYYDRGNIPLDDIYAMGKKHGVPVLVDASAEGPTSPDIYLQGGADMVAYSGGKCVHGPQPSGFLLGREDLLRAGMRNMSPNQSMGRPMKVGKEEYMGALTALNSWFNVRDHGAEFKERERMIMHIQKEISSIDGITTKIVQPSMRSNVAPTLLIHWDENRIKITKSELMKQMWEGKPRIALAGSNPQENWREQKEGRERMANKGVTVMPLMMTSGEETPVAERLQEVLLSAV